MKSRLQAFRELGEHTAQIVGSFGKLWETVQTAGTDPVALDKFALQAITLSQSLGILAERAQQLSEDILDGEE